MTVKANSIPGNGSYYLDDQSQEHEHEFRRERAAKMADYYPVESIGRWIGEGEPARTE